jgi:hypothetical protein
MLINLPDNLITFTFKIGKVIVLVYLLNLLFNINKPSNQITAEAANIFLDEDLPIKIEIPKIEKPEIKLPGWVGAIITSKPLINLGKKIGAYLIDKALKRDKNDYDHYDQDEVDLEELISRELKNPKKH